MPMNNTQERMVHLCSQFQINASDGYVDIASTGPQSSLSLGGNLLQLNSASCFLTLNSQDNAGIIQLSTAVGASDSAILLTANGEVNAAQCTVSPQGILLMYGPPTALGYIQITDGEMMLGMGPALTGSQIAMTPDSITLKVGTTTLTLTSDGIVANSGGTTVAISPEGVTEELGAITRELGMAGHTLVAGESTVELGMSGLTAEGPTGSLAFDASGELSAAMLTESADAVLSQESALVNIGS